MAECEVCGEKIKDGERFCSVCAPSSGEQTEKELGENESQTEKQNVEVDNKTPEPEEMGDINISESKRIQNLDESDDNKEIKEDS